MESFIGVKPETAIQRWRKLSSAVKNPKQRFRFTAAFSVRSDQAAAGAIRSTNFQEMFRVAVLISHAAFQFIDAIDGLDVDSQDKEQTERPEEVNNIGSCYYCHQCDQLVTVTVGVDITGTLCQGCFMEEYGGVSSFHPAMTSESEPSATDSDGHGTRVIPPNQTVLDIVDDTNGSALNRSPLHSTGSYDYNSYGQTHQAPVMFKPGHDDSNPIRSHSLSVGSDHAVTNNSVPGHVVTTSVWSWIFSVTGIGFEAASAFFVQVSTPRKPRYSLYGMLLSIVAVLVCILDLIQNAMKQNRVASASEMIWGIMPEVFGLALACIQCISSALQFSFHCRHTENPLKVSLVPFLFLVVLFAFKYRNGRN